MRRFLTAGILFSCLALPAYAEDDVMAGFYGNTIVSTGGGFEIHMHYRADHTFDFVGSMMFMKRTFKGTWALDDKGNLCRTYIGDAPPHTQNPVCAPVVPRKVGDTWKSNDNKRSFILKAGIV